MKTKEEHLKYCIGILQRGDKIKDAIRYLNYQKVDEEIHDEIINELYQILEDEKLNEVEPVAKKKFSISMDLIMGIIFFIAGLAFIQPLWNRGLISILPFLISAYGLYKIIFFFIKGKK